MKIATWNASTLSASDWKMRLRFVLSFKDEVLCLQETRWDEAQVAAVRSWLQSSGFRGATLLATPATVSETNGSLWGGVAVIIRRGGPEGWSCGSQFQCGSSALGVICTKGETKFGVVTVYAQSGSASACVASRARLFREVSMQVANWEGALGTAGLTILGDFNMITGGVQDSIRRPLTGIRAGAEDIEAYNQMMAVASIKDAWTVLNPRLSAEESATHREGRRIDRILVPHGWLHGGAEITRVTGYLRDARPQSSASDL